MNGKNRALNLTKRFSRHGSTAKANGSNASPQSSTGVRVWSEELTLPTYLPAAPDKNPMFLEKRVYQGSSGKLYPLPFTDRIAEKPVDRKWKAVWIENEFIRALVLPEIGGRIHVLQDKTNGYDVLYHQPVIKPALVGLAGPWISGGIEFNWPQHHRPATFLPVDFEIEEHADGSKTIWCSDHDPLARMKGMHGVCLHPGRAFLELKVRAYNRTALTQTFLWWANVATRVHEAYQSFFPSDVHYVADHARRSMSEFPFCQGHYYGVNYGERGRNGIPENERPTQFAPPDKSSKFRVKRSEIEVLDYSANDLSFYANIPVPTSYMCMGSREDFFGGYDFKAQAGIVHVANHHIAPGKKQWTWGNHEFGYAWDRNLTDADARGEHAPYIELMAGVYTDNQPDFSFLQPGETKTWSQYWYPIRKIGPAQQANLEAAISLQVKKLQARVGVAVTRLQSQAVVTISAKGKQLTRFMRDLSPAEPLVEKIKLPRGLAETDLRIKVMDQTGRELISHQAKRREKTEVPPPASEPPPPSEMTSVDELFITGLHLAQYRHATRCPSLYWREALRRDPLDSRCNNGMGLWHLRRGEFVEAEKHFRQAIERLTRRNGNPADGEAFYNLGLCLRFQHRDDDAYAAFYKSVWNQAWVAPGFHALAEIDCRNADWKLALEHLEQSLRFNTDNTRARNLKAIALQKLGREMEAEALLQATLKLDPLDWWARHLRGEALACDLQTRLDIAHDFARAGLFAEAIELLNAAVTRTSVAQISKSAGRGNLSARQNGSRDAGIETCDTAGLEACATMETGATMPAALLNQSWGALPLVHYTLGWLEHQRGDAKAALKQFQHAASLPPDYCFPARLEEIEILEIAMRANPKDARAPYYLGNLFYDRRRHDEAIRLWQRSAKLDPNFSIVWRNLGIGCFNIRKQPSKARAAYERAFAANPGDARLLFERDQLWKRLGEKPEKRLRELEKHFDLVQQRDDLCVELCALYNQTGRHEDALQSVRSRQFQPWEGGEGGPLGQHVRAQLALGRAAMNAGDFAKAKTHFEQALTSPRNLSEAKHLLANQSDIHYWLGCALNELGEKAPAREHWRTAAEFKGDFQEMSVRQFSEMTYYSALSWERLGQRAKAKKLFSELLEYAQALEQAPAKIDYFATSLPTMLLFEDDLQFRQQTTALFLQAQAQLGLGNRSKSSSRRKSAPSDRSLERNWSGLTFAATRERSGSQAQAQSLLKQVLQRDPNHALARDLWDQLSNGATNSLPKLLPDLPENTQGNGNGVDHGLSANSHNDKARPDSVRGSLDGRAGLEASANPGGI